MAKRQQTVTLQLRMRPGQKDALEAAAAVERRRLQGETPGARLGVGPWLLSLGLIEAARMVGTGELSQPPRTFISGREFVEAAQAAIEPRSDEEIERIIADIESR